MILTPKNRILKTILALLLLISLIVTLLDTMAVNPSKNLSTADSNSNYSIDTAPLQEYQQGHIDSH